MGNNRILSLQEIKDMAERNNAAYWDEEPAYLLIREPDGKYYNQNVYTVAPIFDNDMEKGIIAFCLFGVIYRSALLISQYQRTWLCFTERPREEDIEAAPWINDDDPIAEE